MYCIYTDGDVDQKDGNQDHIVPLSLGGSDDFCVWSEKKFNSDVGSKVDAAIANDPLIMFARRNADARGHSNRKPEPVFKRSTIGGRPAQVTFASDELKIWDARAKRYLTEEEKTGPEIASQLVIDAYAPLRMIAKVSVGGSYFVYGDQIRTACDLSIPRKLINFQVGGIEADARSEFAGTTFCDRFHEDAHDTKSPGFMYRQLCEFTGSTTFICEPHVDSISFHLGVLGAYVASLTIPADTTDLPIDGDHDLGHVILFTPEGLWRISFRQIAQIWYRDHTGEEPPLPGCL